MCKHRFGVQLLQHPPLCISTKNRQIVILNCLKKRKLLTLTSCTADEAKSTVYFRLFLPLVAPQRPRGPEALCVCGGQLAQVGGGGSFNVFFLQTAKNNERENEGD
jgi:hypothetical protein